MSSTSHALIPEDVEAQYRRYVELARVAEVEAGDAAPAGLPEFYAPAPAPLTLTVSTGDRHAIVERPAERLSQSTL